MIFQIDFKFEGLCAATFAPMKENGYVLLMWYYVPCMCKGPINVKNISLNVRDINVDAVPQYASFLSKNDIKGIYGNY